MKIIEKPIGELLPYVGNPRRNDMAVDAVRNSIREFGFINPIIVDKNMVIIAGHTRLKAAQSLGMDKVPVIIADNLTDEQAKMFRIIDNKSAEIAEWDEELLTNELEQLKEVIDGPKLIDLGLTMEDFGLGNFGEKSSSKQLFKDYIVPPFSTLDTRAGYWQTRKKAWLKYIQSENGRDDNLMSEGLNSLAKKIGAKSISGTSIFDPVLAECLVNWFCPVGGGIVDPFAGGSVRGLVSTFLGNSYSGCDLSEKQIEANEREYERLAIKGVKDFSGKKLSKPEWVNDDSLNIAKHFKPGYDMLLTCPPYADLEVYSDKPNDISNMPYEKFIDVYSEILKRTCALLKEDTFACIVISDIRDKKGIYRGFVEDTKAAFQRCGLALYNELVLINQVGTAAVRAGKIFSKSRKTVRLHQNVLVFVKGNARKAVEKLAPYEYDFSSVETEDQEDENV